ncbi:unnamed protein product [Ceutorhynchus assimilis]|uniref:Uncharacterized protein n=1 Tax=Ceutorhynchus assimilis TaxID=467358 RepID=A0A9N9MR25_9CUCU|nr:unnamed protein product [Ceutorhynchus assimilis]
MAPNDMVVKLPAEIKKCKYCRSNVAQSAYKCEGCSENYHSSCALRIKGLRVVNGSKNLVLCPSCADYPNPTTDEEITKKNAEIAKLNQKVSDLQAKNDNMQEEFSWLRNKLDLMEESMHKKLDEIKNIVKKEQQRHKKIIENSAAHIGNAGTDTTERDPALNETNTTEVSTTSLARTRRTTKHQKKNCSRRYCNSAKEQKHHSRYVKFD